MTDTKIVVNASTGEQKIVALTPNELAQREQDKLNHQEELKREQLRNLKQKATEAEQSNELETSTTPEAIAYRNFRNQIGS